MLPCMHCNPRHGLRTIGTLAASALTASLLLVVVAVPNAGAATKVGPQKVLAKTSGLSSVACTSATSCLAVGTNVVPIKNPSTGATRTYKDGNANSEDGEFGVACPTTTVCVGVGEYVTSEGFGAYVREFNAMTGAAGTQVDIPVYGDILRGVACPNSTNCVAVGTSDFGSPDSEGIVVPITDPSTSAIGTVTTVPGMTVLSSITCMTSSTCLAGGYGDAAPYPTDVLITGASTATPTFALNTLTSSGEPWGLTCPTVTTCLSAAGADVLVFNASTGAEVSSTAVPGAGELFGVACETSDTCVAVGETPSDSGAGIVVPITDADSGAIGTPITAIGSQSLDILQGVACPSATACIAVGTTGPGEDVLLPIAPNPVTVTTTSLPGATLAKAYSATLAATGGTAPYKWSVASGKLPKGFSLSTAGVISGTPIQTGTFNVTFEATDKSSPVQDATAAIPITVAA